MTWLSPKEAKIQPGERFYYTNAGAHAIKDPRIRVFRGEMSSLGEWYSCRNNGDRAKKMSEPQFVRRLGWVEPERPKQFSDWANPEGVLFSVLFIANPEGSDSDQPPTVVYASKDTGQFFTRPLVEWYSSMVEARL